MLVTMTSAFTIESHKCANCFRQKYEPVCGERRGTFWNMCELKCKNVTFKHTGECKNEDLLENESNDYIFK
ncbi:unnamed protein product [Diatraea saccharalis]|uniref:Kazal-like domain-containing protein n=1 Tax=Diatraea saccharalis TaxID=40085 RepID=A0A9N9RAG1_9NEOP|nr:unnamed protein product [Diatraea saccharalis]